jgi:hypothetical protein
MGKQIEEIIQGMWIFSANECPPFPLGGRTSFASVGDNAVLFRRIQIACSLSHSYLFGFTF